MKLGAGCPLQKNCFFFLVHQSDSHGQCLAGPQETHTELGLSSSFKDSRNGHHVLPSDKDRFMHTVVTIPLALKWKKLQFVLKRNMIKELLNFVGTVHLSCLKFELYRSIV